MTAAILPGTHPPSSSPAPFSLAPSTDNHSRSNCAIDRGEERIELDLNHDLPPLQKGKRQPKLVKFTLRQTTQIDLSIINAYLTGQIDFNTKVLEALNFLDHAIRQGPSERLVAIRRNFYPKVPGKDSVYPLNNILECVKGVYASVRLNQLVTNGFGLGLNIDVANTAFYVGGQGLPAFIKQWLWMNDPRLRNKSMNDLAEMVRPVKGNQPGKWEKSEVFKLLMRLKRLKFSVTHRGKEQNPRPYTLAGFDFNDSYGAQGGVPKNVSLEDHDTGKPMKIYDFYKQKYNYTIQEEKWPLVLTERAGKFPIDACKVERMQKYPFKLDADATSAMIKAAVTRPPQRHANIMSARALLNLENDKYLQGFGLDFERQMVKTTGKLLPPPRVQFANGYADPKLSGRWDLKGKKFWKASGIDLKNWGILILDNSCQTPQARAFVNAFQQTFKQHGCPVIGEPIVIDSERNNHNIRSAVVSTINKFRQKNMPCQMLFCVVRRQDIQMYERIKAAAECEHAVLTQVVLSKHVERCQGQYLSNVAMKVNSKLGGQTCRVPHPTSKAAGAPAFFKDPTMIIGGDVTHPPPGDHEYLLSSICALTMSMDRDAARYAAMVESNGYRVEMITAENIHKFLDKYHPLWSTATGIQQPTTIYYFRDGLAEGQFATMLEVEIAAVKSWYRKKNMKMPKITAIVATKRHHIRFFPAPGHGDKNNNPNPGTVLETAVCHPFQWDFYLSSHSAIQGTARPVHYHVLLDENNCTPAALQAMIYGQCYQYARSTTPVSLHPAIYYADIAAARGRSHENPRTLKPNPKFDRGQHSTTGSFDQRKEAAPPLLPMGDETSFGPAKELCKRTMWFI